MNALEVLQLLDAVPFRTAHLGEFDAQLVVDVGFDRKFFAVSLLIGRARHKSPTFGVYTAVHHKPDSKKEKINPILLKDAILDIFDTAMFNAVDPLDSLLVLRDGRVQEAEMRGFDDSFEELRERGTLGRAGRVDVVGLHKTSLKKIRMWNNNGKVSNVLGGTGISIDSNTFVFCSTGAATLIQGTASPLTLVGAGRNESLTDAGYSAFAAAQLNWSSPSVAQRLPLPFKRTDDELSARLSQEIRRIR